MSGSRSSRNLEVGKAYWFAGWKGSSLVSTNTEYYFTEAEIAQRMALKVRNPEQRLAWLKLAADWLSLVHFRYVRQQIRFAPVPAFQRSRSQRPL